MKSLDLKKLKVELLQVQAGKASLELRIEEMLEEIEKLKLHIGVSEAKEQELINKIKE